MSASETVPVVRLEHLTKRFPRVLAVNDVSIDFLPGEIHAVVGENGAGKTTLMNLVYGVHQPDHGRILIQGEPVMIRKPADAIEHGIALVHQHFQLVPSFTVAENLMMVQHRELGLVPDRDRFAQEIADVARRFGLELDPHVRVSELSLGVRHRVEILAGLLRNARLLILDEPTAVLAPPEVGGLFDALRRIAREGRALVLITHKLPEVFDVGDSFSVMRHGQLIRTGRTTDSSPAEVAMLMVGREAASLETPTTVEVEPGQVVLRVEGIELPPLEASPGLAGVSFSVREGEIVAVAGVEGNGQVELVEALIGLRKPTAGHIWLRDKDITGVTRRRSARMGLGVIPEDRHAEGLILGMDVAENITLDRIREPEFSRGGIWLLVSRIRGFARRASAAFQIRAPSTRTPVRMLSGGNQQKVVLARVLSSSPQVLIAAQPTTGLDIEATRYVLDQLVTARSKGAAVLLVSSDLDHVLSLSDRIIVLFKGRVAGVLHRASTTRETLGQLMAGVTPAASDDEESRRAVVDQSLGEEVDLA